MMRFLVLAGIGWLPVGAVTEPSLPVPPIPPQIAPLPPTSGAFSPAPVPDVDLLPPQAVPKVGPQLAPSIAAPPQRSQTVGEAFVPGSKVQLPEERKNLWAPGLNLKLPLQ